MGHIYYGSTSPQFTPDDGRLTEVEVTLALTYPRKTRLSDSFTIEAQPEIRDAKNLSFLDHTPTEPGKTPNVVVVNREDLPEAEREYYIRHTLFCILDLPGMDFTPEAASRNRQPFVWKVRPKSTGHFSGVIKPRDSEKIYNFTLWNLLSHKHKPPELEIEVTDKWLDRDSIRAAFVYVMGSLLTVPGAVAFVREVRRTRNQRREQEKSKLILP